MNGASTPAGALWWALMSSQWPMLPKAPTATMAAICSGSSGATHTRGSGTEVTRKPTRLE